MTSVVVRRTDIDRPIGFDQLPTPRGTTVGWIAAISVTAALVGGPIVDRGTRVDEQFDYRPAIDGTSLNSIHVEGTVAPFRAPTRMAQVRALAPLSLREWATVFGVSHSAIKQWADGEEPDRQKLDRVLGALTEASGHQADLAAWLRSSLPGMDVRPIDLLRDDRWRAFRGAMRTRSAPQVEIDAQELLNRRQAQVSWATPEPMITVLPDE